MSRLIVCFGLALAACMDAAEVAPPTLPGPGELVDTCATGADACTAAGAWCRTTDQCHADMAFCQCQGGHYVCGRDYTTAEIEACDPQLAPLTACVLEGSGVCDLEPVGGGSCACANGVWACVNACDGCPLQVPTDGDACTTVSACRYLGKTCTCTAGVFACAPT